MKYDNRMILLVEDHRSLAEGIAAYLEAEGYAIDFASSGTAALRLATDNHYDAIVLDIGLPGIDGLEVCRSLRRDTRSTIPIIMLTARDQLDDRLAGFDAGADDYLVKPFAMSELAARLVALLRRSHGVLVDGRFEVGELALDVPTLTVSRCGQPVRLSRKQFDILHLLMREHPRVVSKAAVERMLWGDELPDSDALRSHIYNLRKQLDRGFDYDIVETLPGIGFRLRSPVLPR